MIGENQSKNMDINKKYKTFISFLKKKGCYESFKENYYIIEEKEPTYHDNLSIKQSLYIGINDVILYSFDWLSTSEGWDYWSEIDDDWRVVVFENGW